MLAACLADPKARPPAAAPGRVCTGGVPSVSGPTRSGGPDPGCAGRAGDASTSGPHMERCFGPINGWETPVPRKQPLLELRGRGCWGCLQEADDQCVGRRRCSIWTTPNQ